MAFTLGGGILWANRHKIQEWIKLKFIDKKKLLKHDLFDIIHSMTEIEIKSIQFEGHETKEQILKDFLLIKLEEIQAEAIKFLESPDIYDLSKSDLKQRIYDMFYTIVRNHDARWRLNFNEGGLDSEEIEHIIECFNVYHTPTVKSIEKRIKGIFASGNYVSNYNRINTVLEVFAFSIDLVFSEGVRSFEALNGKLDKLNYVPMKLRA